MVDVKTIMFGDKEYINLGELQINGVEYIQFANIDNPKDFCIRKVNVIDGEEMIVGLDNKEEFDMAFKAFFDKHAKDLQN